jgi:acetyltransferase-like isoleucine patch superfamily enzyme
MTGLLLKIRRGETPFYRRLKLVAATVQSSALPVPHFLRPVLRLVYHTLHGAAVASRWSLAVFFCTPLFTARCECVGKRLRVARLPFVVGHARIRIGSNVFFCGKTSIHSGRIFDDPTLMIGDRVVIGHGVVFMVNKEIVLEDDVMIAGGCSLADSDAHPRDPERRSKGLPPAKEEVKPIRIRRSAWISGGAQIRKGVTVGEGAIVGVNSVVLTDVPAHCIVMGNPARVVGFAGGARRPTETAARSGD